MRVILRRHIDAAHQLPYHDGKCRRLHGHRFTVEIVVEGTVQADDPANPESGMLVDFGRLKDILDRELPDHLSLNRVTSLGDGVATTPMEACEAATKPDAASRWPHALDNPTSELLAVKLYGVLAPQIDVLAHPVEGTALNLRLHEVRVWETPDACSVYP